MASWPVRCARLVFDSGLLFGTIVWTVDYIVLPLARLYKPMWDYELPILAKDLSAHLVYGIGTSIAFKSRVLNR